VTVFYYEEDVDAVDDEEREADSIRFGKKNSADRVAEMLQVTPSIHACTLRLAAVAL